MNETHFNGVFVTKPEEMAAKLSLVRAFVFDWDGVFNDGEKDANGSSPFNEVDAMGTNLIRFNHYLRTKQVPVSAIISGEKNELSFSFAKREHFQTVYFRVKHKINALEHLCKAHNLRTEEVAFFFDDVLDFSAAKMAGLRIMINRHSTPLLKEYVLKNNLADYITAFSGGEHGIREAVEMLMGVSGIYTETIDQRAHFSETYKQYLEERNRQPTSFYGTDALQPVNL